MEVDLATIAGHEAAHAIMRHLCGMPATELTATPKGGYCAGTGKMVRVEDELLVALAGVAWEAGCGLRMEDTDLEVVLSTPNFLDLTDARELLVSHPFLWPLVQLGETWGFTNPETVLLHHFKAACERLCPYVMDVETLGRD